MDQIHGFVHFLLVYGYWLAVPLMIIEGPLTTVVMGFLASLGFFNILMVIALGVISDLISDGIYYYLGYHGGPKVMRGLKIPQLEENHSLQDLKEKFETHPARFFFSAKVLTGLAYSTFVLAGVTRVNYKKILEFSIWGGIIWSTALGFLGFYFGRQARTINLFLSRAGLVIFLLLAFALVYKFWLGKIIRERFAVWKNKNV